MRRCSWFLLSCCGLAAPGASFAGGEAIPFREAWGWAVVVPVSVAGGGVHEFLLDTGTTSTLLDPALAEELGLATTSRVNLVTPAGEREVGVAQADLRIGGTVLAGVEILIAELPAVRSDEPRACAGCWGSPRSRGSSTRSTTHGGGSSSTRATGP